MDAKQKDQAISSIVGVLSCVLKQLCARNDQLPSNQRQVSKFHALRPPAISILDYLTRVARYSACSPECFVLALVYIDRIIQSSPQFVVDSLNIHRLLITSIMLAAKFFDDQYYNNTYYAKVGGVSSREINSLEVEFLFMANFTLAVSTETYSQYYFELRNHAANGHCSCSSYKVPPLKLPEFKMKRQLISPQVSTLLRPLQPDEPNALSLPPYDPSRFGSPDDRNSKNKERKDSSGDTIMSDHKGPLVRRRSSRCELPDSRPGSNRQSLSPGRVNNTLSDMDAD